MTKQETSEDSEDQHHVEDQDLLSGSRSSLHLESSEEGNKRQESKWGRFFGAYSNFAY